MLKALLLLKSNKDISSLFVFELICLFKRFAIHARRTRRKYSTQSTTQRQCCVRSRATFTDNRQDKGDQKPLFFAVYVSDIAT